MKFEDIIKQKVEQHKEAYDPKAWETLSSKLGNAGAASAAKTTTLIKWIVAASMLSAVIGCVIYFSAEEQHQQPTEQLNEVNADNVISNTSEDKATVTANEKGTATKAIEKEITQPENRIVKIKKAIENNHLISVESTEKINEEPVIDPVSNTKESNSQHKLFINWATKICSNEIVVLKNDNEEAIRIESNSISQLVAARQSIKSSDLEAGIYKIKANNGSLLQTLEIVAVPKLNFISEEVVFEKGLPFIPAKITDNELSSYNWDLNDQAISAKREVMIPAFKKGNCKVIFTGTDHDCSVKETYNVIVKEDYNLLAVNAFNVESRDERNRTFLPFALYEREEAFVMQITDAKTGEVIFKTNAIENPWNGIDGRTGELVPSNTHFIWTVSLSKKANFESNAVYKGTIMRVVY